MDIGRLSYFSRKLHRWSLLFVIVLGLIQMITGLTMRYPEFFSLMNQENVRLLHFQTATYFSIAFGVQMLTGIIMYLTP
ncbi:MAG: hypothetical protein AAB492_05540 [Patescibacteria group bacterium]